jgi:hypothetical protein
MIRVTIDLEQCKHEPRSWLWTVRVDGRLRAAGVERYRDTAWHMAETYYYAAVKGLPETGRRDQPPARDAVILDLDRLERGQAPTNEEVEP